MIDVLKIPTDRDSISPRRPTLAARVCLAAAMVLVLASTATAQQCLHGADESASERGRRQAAVAFVERVNAAQRDALAMQGTYVALADAVPLADVPLGFVPRLTADRWSYAISLKDLFDPCGFALFSDQDGLVYEARPVSRAAEASSGDVGPVGSALVLAPPGTVHLQQRHEDGNEREGAQEGNRLEHQGSGA